MMPVVLLGGIYSGVTTPTEAAAVAAAYALLISVVLYRSVSFARLLPLAAGQRPHHGLDRHADRRRAGVQLRRHRREHPAVAQRRCCTSWDLSPIGFLILVNVLLLVLGCVLEGTTILLVIVPVLIPTAQALGIDMVHFGVVVVVNIMIGLITPPYGLLLFIMTQHRRGAAAGHRARRAAVPLGDDRRAGAHHLRSRTRALAAAAVRLPGLIEQEPHESRSTSSTARTSTGSASASRRSTARRRWPRSRRCAARPPATRPLRFHQSNAEGEIIDWIHEAIDEGAGIVINPAGFTFTSIAILDALKMFPGPIIELHISNIHRREAIYHHSLVSKVATAVIAGLGPRGYPVAVRAIADMIAAASKVP